MDEQYLLLKESEGSGLWREGRPRARSTNGGGTVLCSSSSPPTNHLPNHRLGIQDLLCKHDEIRRLVIFGVYVFVYFLMS